MICSTETSSQHFHWSILIFNNVNYSCNKNKNLFLTNLDNIYVIFKGDLFSNNIYKFIKYQLGYFTNIYLKKLMISSRS